MRATPNHLFSLTALPALLEGREETAELKGGLSKTGLVLPDGTTVKAAYLAPRKDASPLRAAYEAAIDRRTTQNAAAKLALSQIVARAKGSELLQGDAEVQSAITELESLLVRKASSKESITVGDVKGSFTTLASATERLEQKQRHSALSAELDKTQALPAAQAGDLLAKIWPEQTKVKADGSPATEMSAIADAFNSGLFREQTGESGPTESASSTPLMKEISIAARQQNQMTSVCKSGNLTEKEAVQMGKKTIEANKEFVKTTDAAMNRDPLLAKRYRNLSGVPATMVQMLTRAELLFKEMNESVKKHKPNLLAGQAQEFLTIFSEQLEAFKAAAATFRDPTYLASIAPDRRPTMLAMAKNCDDLATAMMAPDSPFMAFYQLCKTVVADPSGACTQLRKSMDFSDKPVGSAAPTEASANVSNAQPSIRPEAHGKVPPGRRSVPVSPTQQRRAQQELDANKNVYRVLKREPMHSKGYGYAHGNSKAGDLILSQLQSQQATSAPKSPLTTV